MLGRVVLILVAVSAGNGQPAHIITGKTYTITTYYKQGDIPSYVNESTLAYYYWESSTAQWIKDSSGTVDTIANTVTAAPNHFSQWAILGEVHRIFLPAVLRK